MTQKGPYLIAASYDLTISVTDLSSDAASVAVPLKFGLQNAQGNRVIGLQGSRFAVASNPSIHIYDRTAKTNKPFQTCQGHQTNVTDLTTDGSRLFSSSEDETWKTWDFTTSRAIATAQAGCSLNAIALVNDNSQIVTGNDHGQVEVWGVTDSALVAQHKVGASAIRSIAAGNAPGSIVIGCIDGAAFTAKIAGAEISEVRKIQAHAVPITRVAASPDGKLFATAAADASSKLWDWESGELKANLVDRNQTRWVWDVAFTADSQFVCTGGTDKVCRVWEVATGELKRQIEWHQKGVTCIAVI
jgi:G protein beta subunit-like protein